MKRLTAGVVIAVAALVGVAATAAQAQSATVCHSVKVTANGQEVVNDSGCQTVPPPGE